MSTSPDPSLILTWLYTDIAKGDYVGLAIGLGVAYYWIGGLPNQGQDMMQLAQGYLAGGVGAYAYAYAMKQPQ